MLALATFSAVRSSNRSARIAEETLLTGMRPLLVPSLIEDPVHKVLWQDRHTAKVGGGRAVAEEDGGVVYLAIGLRNLGTGIALLHGWYPNPDQVLVDRHHVEVEDFRRLTIDLYVPAGGTGYCAPMSLSSSDGRHRVVELPVSQHGKKDIAAPSRQGHQRLLMTLALHPFAVVVSPGSRVLE